MTTEEFSTEFDTLLNSWDFGPSYGSTRAPIVLDEYEKSVFLTKAQTEIVLDIYRSFEQTEEVTSYLDALVTQKTFTTDLEGPVLDTRSVVFETPEDLWFRTHEKAVISDSSLECNGNSEREVEVVPVTQDMLYRTKESPFRGPNSRRVLRLVNSDSTVEIISKYPVVSYTVRYIRRPSPIVLQDLPDNLSVDGANKEQTCLLSDSLHKRILERAVALAVRSKLPAQSNESN